MHFQRTYTHSLNHCNTTKKVHSAINHSLQMGSLRHRKTSLTAQGDTTNNEQSPLAELSGSLIPHSCVLTTVLICLQGLFVQKEKKERESKSFYSMNFASLEL